MLFSYSTAASDATIAAAATTPFRRVAGITISDITFDFIPEADQQAAVLWRVLDQCVVPAEHRAHAHCGNDDIPPAALVKIDIMFAYDETSRVFSILGPLTTKYSMLVRSLRALSITRSGYDESTALGAFAALATRLTELTFFSCGLTSVRGLEGHCENLRRVNLWGCEQLRSLDGLGSRVALEEVDVSYNATLTSIEPLRTCPALKTVYLYGCQELYSIGALEGHQCLQEVVASQSPITTIEPLRTCPALTTVVLFLCQQLASIDALEGHQCLQEVNVSNTNITSIEPLRSCPALTKVYLIDCEQLPTEEVGLPASVEVIRSY